MKINLVSLGCPKNLVDSENILGALGAAGTIICSTPQESDVIIINTCGFIEPALEETEQTIEEMLEYVSNGKKLYVMGCAVNRFGNELRHAFPKVTAWFRIEDTPKLEECIKSGAENIKARLPTTYGYAYLKISDGCSNNCAYCTIPSIKGAYHSFDFNEIVREGYELAKLGIKELIIIGQDTTRYGIDLYGKPMLRNLLRDLSQIPGIEWLRLMYTHPKTINGDIIEEIGRNNKICKYVDLPIQHINDRILRLMNRGTDQHNIMKILKRLKEIDNMAIRTTIIVGYPSETDDEFDELMEFIKHGCIDWLGVFPYYRELGTDAANLEQLPAGLIEERYQQAITLQQQIVHQRNKSRLGHEYKVLTHAGDGDFVGHTEFAAPEVDSQVLIRGNGIEVGSYYNVRITGTKGYDLCGELGSEKLGEG